jgi:hypothetical protein
VAEITRLTTASGTAKITSHFIEHNGVAHELIDTPGFDDSYRSDEEILEELIGYLAHDYKIASSRVYCIYTLSFTAESKAPQ